jgi:hypothetical protein
MTNSVHKDDRFTGACAFFVDPDGVGHRIDGSSEDSKRFDRPVQCRSLYDLFDDTGYRSESE